MCFLLISKQHDHVIFASIEYPLNPAFTVINVLSSIHCAFLHTKMFIHSPKRVMHFYAPYIQTHASTHLIYLCILCYVQRNITSRFGIKSKLIVFFKKKKKSYFNMKLKRFYTYIYRSPAYEPCHLRSRNTKRISNVQKEEEEKEGEDDVEEQSIIMCDQTIYQVRSFPSAYILVYMYYTLSMHLCIVVVCLIRLRVSLNAHITLWFWCPIHDLSFDRSFVRSSVHFGRSSSSFIFL